ncbi:MAG: M23 family metallopeptidase [Firmicutes bacterium]|nr:M23 family metallopeptidase [Bacillota bacterium]
MGLIEWISPVIGRISSPAGYRRSPIHGTKEFHDGVDIAVPVGTVIVAPLCGYVVAAGYSTSFGWFLRISHGCYETFYAHLDYVPIAVGDRVGQGERIAYSGNTGWSTGPHLHFGMFRDGQFVDPQDYVTFSECPVQ